MTASDRSTAGLLTAVVPFLNETAVLNAFFERLMPQLAATGMRHEVVCVDNCSTDDTPAQLLAWRERHPEIKVVRFSRYFGKEAALAAGLRYARGDAVIVMDPDLQDPPEMIAEFLEKWREGYDIVYATRRLSGIETGLKAFLNTLFYRFFNFISETNIPQKTGDFRLLDRRIIMILRQLPERSRFLRGLSSWVGFRSTSILFDRPPRPVGRSKSNYLFLWGYALDAILSSTTRPLRIWTYIGFGVSLLALLAGIALIARRLIFGMDVPGFASVMVGILFMGGFQLISIGVVAEYVGRIYREVQNRPLYIVDRAYGIEEDVPAWAAREGQD